MAASSTTDASAPQVFRNAVTCLRDSRPRAEIVLEEIAAPGRIAPYAFALAGRVEAVRGHHCQGRLILLHDPAGHDAWNGTLRLVTYVSVELDADMAGDPVLAAVAWSWLMDGLYACGARYTAPGGTVTCTVSSRFGELARHPAGAASAAEVGDVPEADLEMRASWTPLGADLTAHMHGWCALLASAAGLPPEGVSLIG